MSDDASTDPLASHLVGFDEACDVAWRSRFDLVIAEQDASTTFDGVDGIFSGGRRDALVELP